MPTFRTVPATRGAAWLAEGLLALRRTPGAFLTACALVALLRSLPLLGVFLGMLMPVFYAGLVSLLRTRAQGGSGRAAQAYDGFVAPGAFARLLPVASFNVLFVMAVAAVLVYVAGDAFSAVLETARAGGQPRKEEVAALLARMAPAALAIAPVAVFVAWVQMLAIPRAMLYGVPGGAALREAAAAVWANLGAFVVNLVCLAALLFAVLLGAALALVVVGLVMTLVPALAGLLQLAVVIALTAVFHAIYATVMYQAVGEVFGEVVGDEAGPPPPPDAIEA
jgi:hypothetical protein